MKACLFLSKDQIHLGCFPAWLMFISINCFPSHFLISCWYHRKPWRKQSLMKNNIFQKTTSHLQCLWIIRRWGINGLQRCVFMCFSFHYWIFSRHFRHPRLFAMRKTELTPSTPVLHILPTVVLSNNQFLACPVMTTPGFYVLLYLPCVSKWDQINPNTSQGRQVQFPQMDKLRQKKCIMRLQEE